MNRLQILLIFFLGAFSSISNVEVLACDRCGLVSSCFHQRIGNVHGLQAGANGDVHDDDLAAFRTQGNGWTSTSSGSSGLGRPATLTWSIVPDNTQLPTGLSEPVSNSSLISFLDGIHHGGNSPGNADLTQRDWWHLFDSAFERWDAVSGISFNYEPNDDGRKLGTASGVLGTRGDHRIGGHPIDGQTSPTFLAYNYFPNNSDMVIDTDEINRWSDSTSNYLLFRNMLMHEIGHGIGLNHVEPTNQSKLMEPRITTEFDGPQLDDILGAHRLYGDNNESGPGNDTFADATEFGTLNAGQVLSVGTDAVSAAIDPSQVDFVSIDDDSDVDYFRFTIDTPRAVSLLLTPLGPTYEEGSTANNAQPFDSSAQSNLTLTLLDTDGTSTLAFANNNGLGLSEEISNLQLTTAGDYFVRIGGLHNAAQFFQLDIASVPEPSTLLMGGMGILLLASRRRSQQRRSRLAN